MTHKPRQRSESGFYHVVTKGDGSQIIFESDKDRLRYLQELASACKDFEIKVHAYCLMGNHVHLLVQDQEENLSGFMKQLNERYAMYFRRITGRVGHIFQRPYWSEPIKTDEHFLCAVRYIHANPQVARICTVDKYQWSSYQAHLAKSPLTPLVEVGFTRELLGGGERFESFSSSSDLPALPFPGSKLRGHLSSDEVLQVAWSAIGKDTLNSLKSMQPEERAAPIKALKKAGLTEREIARLSGVGRTSVRNALSIT